MSLLLHLREKPEIDASQWLYSRGFPIQGVLEQDYAGVGDCRLQGGTWTRQLGIRALAEDSGSGETRRGR
jgi:hypothetical protein